MQTTFSTTFILRTAKSKDGKTPIYCRITVAGTRVEFSIKRCVAKKNWEAGKVKGNGEDALMINSYLKQVEAKIFEHYREMLAHDKFVTADSLKDTYFGIKPKFSTGFDNTLSRILAFQLLKDHLLKLIDNLNHDSPQKATLLIELIYALHGDEPINNGAADIKQIADSFERLFDINLGNYYRQFQEIQEIRLKKNGSTTLLDLMKDRFLNGVDELDEK